MRTAEICPTCATYTNALCVLYDGPTVLTNINVDPLDSLDAALVNINTAVGAINTAIGNIDLDEVLSNGNVSTITPFLPSVNFGTTSNFGQISFGSDTFTFGDSLPNNICEIKDGEITIISNGGTIDAKITSTLLTVSRTFNLPNKNGTFAMLSDIPATPTLQQVLTAGRISTITPWVPNIEIGTGSNPSTLYCNADTFVFADTQPNDIFRIKDGEITIVSLGMSIDAKITSSLLSANRNFNLPDKSGTIALTNDIPKRFIALISQSGTANPTLTIVRNDFSGTISATRNAAGDYTITNTLPEFTNNKTTACINNSTNYAVKFTGATRTGNTTISLAVFNITGSAADTLLLGDVLQIEVYP